MEVAAAVSSVAGILCLTGQSIQGIIALKSFFLDVSSASETIDRFIRDINSLLHVLHDIEKLLQGVSGNHAPNGVDVNLASLHIQLEDSVKDVVQWLKIANDIRPSRKGRRAWFKKFYVAVNKTQSQT